MSESTGASRSESLRVGDVFECSIHALASGGEGVGRAPDGRIAFVPLSAPGDLLEVRLEKIHPRYVRAEIEHVLEPGSARVTPECEVFGSCGGCTWQHLDYALQCEAKRAIVEDALERVGHLEVPKPVPFTPSPSPYRYRARARLAVQGGLVGYRRRRSHTLAEARRCPVLTGSLEEELRALAAASPADGEWEIAVGVLGGGAHGPGASGPALELEVAGDRLRVSGGVFFQAHAGLQGALVEAVSRAVGQGALAVELFAGAGFFTLSLARSFARVVAVEEDPAAVADLEHNVARAGLLGVQAIRARVEEALAGDALRAERPDAVLLDPPRAGLAPGDVARIAELGAPRVVYLSCDPATLARDLAGLATFGYALAEVRAFDLFPQTPHVEVLACLVASERPTGRLDPSPGP
jgi:23S rRNA (uracil1939-C5)-methyltransferase